MLPIFLIIAVTLDFTGKVGNTFGNTFFKKVLPSDIFSHNFTVFSKFITKVLHTYFTLINRVLKKCYIKNEF